MAAMPGTPEGIVAIILTMREEVHDSGSTVAARVFCCSRVADM